MNPVERLFGGWLHGVIVAHPLAHAELLNQYRSSEDFGRRFPATICTALLEDGPLRAKYAKHQADEERHEGLYAERIRALGGEVRDVGDARDYMLAVWREASAAGVGIPYARFGEARALDAGERARLWAIQSAVEERGLIEMALHKRACAEDRDTTALLDSILPDERHHAAYSLRALKDEAGEGALALLDVMREAEDRAYQRVTGAFLSALVAGPLANAGLAARGFTAALARLSPFAEARPAAEAW